MIAALYVQPDGVYAGLDGVEVISRADAKAAGLNRYYTGKPCCHGHVALRDVASHGCSECLRLRSNLWKNANPEKRRETERKSKQKRAAKITEEKRVWRKNNPEKHKAAQYRWMINRRMKVCDFDALMSAQDGKCAICGTSKGFSGGGDGRRLAIDHCHKTLEVRGLLCGNCNRMLGLAKDDPDLLRKAATYLEQRQ